MLDYTSITYLNICDGSASIATDAIYCYDFNYLMKRNFDSEYFAKGAYRLAFRGTIYGEGPRDGTIWVTKVFKRKYTKDWRMAPWL